MTTQIATQKSGSRASQYWALTKPRVTMLAVFCAVIGMFLATDGMPAAHTVIAATIGIWLLAAAAFAVNCLAEREIDARMARTARRPTVVGDITVAETVVFAGVIGGAGMWVLYTLVNPLTMWLTFVTFVGYALIYTMILKPATPQNIVIGGLSGAMPPALGWAAVANDVPMQAWLLVLIIFVWTPPHFWALAMYRRDDYARSGLPMLPITHGMPFTQLNVLLYSIALAATCILPYAVHMSGLIYLAAAVLLNAVFLYYAWMMYRHYTDQIARKAFTWSIIYLALLFAALLVDHYIPL
ncbi:heme o synthase [Oxalobacteraceae bacterium A2-2]|jgi:protoheme IX farnesyltransferase